ncbi:RagB/SusD family nutrient uptake outer membrane protein [Polaribacter sp. Hel1_85]|uniref:RagB/SusD family nutrient uptake outer membrane protein n=1 Tax=Polaribacter sp. Hel1_85 TaxID=1250005 RepID=UPI00055F4AEA|nr:RagB/SusD family nutrient uptake outer membrane protein [Polaribacter sp. Hel1_85]
MKTIKYIYIITITVLFFSCEDYLDKSSDTDGLDQESVFSDVVLAKYFLDGAYTKLITEISSAQDAPDNLPGMVMGSEGYPGRRIWGVPETYNVFAQGNYLSLMNGAVPVLRAQRTNMTTRYTQSWQGIRIVNEFLENVDLISNANEEEINRLKGQAYFLRAFHFHLLTKRHGGLVYLKENLALNEELTQIRESYESNYENILLDINLAIDLLPISWESEDVGRPTKGAALALKSRVTLFGASPLVTTDQTRWKEAAEAASDLINFANNNGLYSLINASSANSIDVGHNGTDLFTAEPAALESYRSIFVGPGITKVLPSEVIYAEVNRKFFDFGGILNPAHNLALTAGFDIMRGNTSPQGIGALPAFVDKFETKTGLPITDPASGYNPQEPFINRDPRYYNAILFDGVSWIHTNGAINSTGKTDLAVLNEEGKYGSGLYPSDVSANTLWQVRCETGYRIRKWIPNGAKWFGGTRGEFDFHINNNIFRMSEIYLNYAEATNEAYGPNAAAPGATLTAVDAVNMIRNRVGMPNVAAQFTGDKNAFRDRIKNERAVELCFEGIRYDDLRRWKDLEKEENKKVEFLEMRWQEGGVSTTYPTGFSYSIEEQPLLKKTFGARNYWWPIPSSETELIPEFQQTPGY